MGAVQQLMSSFGAAPPPVGNFPVRLSNTQTVVTPAATAHNIAMPASVTAGDLLLVFISTSTNSAMTTPAGWTLLNSTANGPRGGVYYKVAAGTEGGTTVNFATGGSTGGSAQVFRYQVGTFTGAPQIATATTGSSTSPNPGNLTPSGGSGDFAWIASASYGDTGGTASVYPLPSGQLTTTPTGGASIVATCYEDATGSSKDPGAFTVGVSVTWVSYTVALRGL